VSHNPLRKAQTKNEKKLDMDNLVEVSRSGSKKRSKGNVPKLEFKTPKVDKKMSPVR